MTSGHASAFEERARIAMSRYLEVKLAPGRIEGIPKIFDLVSPDQSVVGDAKYYTMVGGVRLPPAKFATIAEYVWLLEKTPARKRFLVFGNDRRVPEGWLARYGHLAGSVSFYFLDEHNSVEVLS